MIHEVKGNLLDAKGIILHGCNAQGVMGSGVALAIRNKWPGAYEKYKAHCSDLEVHPRDFLGDVVWYSEGDVVIGNCITQEFYGRNGRRFVSYDAVDKCMEEVGLVAAQSPQLDINFPLIGCGLGGGYWPVVREIIEYRIPDSLKKVLWIQ